MGKCKPCHGGGKLYGAFGDSWDCIPCDGTGTIHRTGPYRLADGTWSDGVDRDEPLIDRSCTAGRFEVWRDDWGTWKAYCYQTPSRNEWYEEFPTHAEAIAYADRMARTNQGENND